ncbi:MAG: hypothetical protein HY914_23445 [Desulfomonile tiedjei]|nr:hypothetical protein [Desulfomonile tiedjei]
MSNSYINSLDNFMVMLAKWLTSYDWYVCSFISLKATDGIHLLFGRVIFEPSWFVNDRKPFVFETEHVKAGYITARFSQGDLDNVIENARAGKFMSPYGMLQLHPGQQQFHPMYYYPIYHPSISDGPRLPCLIIGGDSRHNLLTKTIDQRHIDWELKAADAPFDGFDDLLAYCNLPTLRQLGDTTTLEFVARSPAFISNMSTIKEGEGIIECQTANNIDLNKIKIGYKIFNKGVISRGNVHGDKFDWTKTPGMAKGWCRIEVKNASVMQVFLSYDDVAMHQWWVIDPEKQVNPRYAIHQIFDQDLDQLRKMLLKPDTDKPYVFEGAVSTLFSLLGFSVSNYGRIPKLQKGPDIIAVTPMGHIGVVECTTGLLDENDKLAKLVQRTKLIKENLSSSGHGYLQIQPTIVTPLSRDEVAANLESAGKHKIAVICKEDIENMLNLISLPLNPDKLFEDATKLIPGNNQGALFPEL